MSDKNCAGIENRAYVKSEHQPRQVEERLNILEKEVSIIQDAISAMEPRLEKVLREPHPEPESKDAPIEDKILVPLAKRLTKIKIQLATSRRVVESILDRLEL